MGLIFLHSVLRSSYRPIVRLASFLLSSIPFSFAYSFRRIPSLQFACLPPFSFLSFTVLSSHSLLSSFIVSISPSLLCHFFTFLVFPLSPSSLPSCKWCFSRVPSSPQRSPRFIHSLPHFSPSYLFSAIFPNSSTLLSFLLPLRVVYIVYFPPCGTFSLQFSFYSIILSFSEASIERRGASICGISSVGLPIPQFRPSPAPFPRFLPCFPNHSQSEWCWSLWSSRTASAIRHGSDRICTSTRWLSKRPTRTRRTSRFRSGNSSNALEVCICQFSSSQIQRFCFFCVNIWLSLYRARE